MATSLAFAETGRQFLREHLRLLVSSFPQLVLSVHFIVAVGRFHWCFLDTNLHQFVFGSLHDTMEELTEGGWRV